MPLEIGLAMNMFSPDARALRDGVAHPLLLGIAVLPGKVRQTGQTGRGAGRTHDLP